ncbi:hypothetical protein HN51_051537, partial [Arachis hypogaea]
MEARQQWLVSVLAGCLLTLSRARLSAGTTFRALGWPDLTGCQLSLGQRPSPVDRVPGKTHEPTVICGSLGLPLQSLWPTGLNRPRAPSVRHAQRNSSRGQISTHFFPSTFRIYEIIPSMKFGQGTHAGRPHPGRPCLCLALEPPRLSRGRCPVSVSWALACLEKPRLLLGTIYGLEDSLT